MATILPKRKLLKLAALLTKPDNTAAVPIPTESMIAIAISAYWGIFFRIASIPNAAPIQVTVAPTTGFI